MAEDQLQDDGTPKLLPGDRDRPFISGPTQPGPKEHWDMVRGALIHEDNLINHRLTWLFAGHAFLFLAFGSVQNAVLSNQGNGLCAVVLEIALAGVFVGAIFIARTVGFTIAFANAHHSHLAYWWDKTYEAERNDPVDVQQMMAPSDVLEHQNPEPENQTKKPRRAWLKSIASFDYSTSPCARRPLGSYPPIRGAFKGGPSFVTIPLVFMSMDALLSLACVCILFAPLFQHVDDRRVNIVSPINIQSPIEVHIPPGLAERPAVNPGATTPGVSTEPARAPEPRSGLGKMDASSGAAR